MDIVDKKYEVFKFITYIIFLLNRQKGIFLLPIVCLSFVFD